MGSKSTTLTNGTKITNRTPHNPDIRVENAKIPDSITQYANQKPSMNSTTLYGNSDNTDATPLYAGRKKDDLQLQLTTRTA